MCKALITTLTLVWLQLNSIAQYGEPEQIPIRQKEEIKTESVYWYLVSGDSSLYCYITYDNRGNELTHTYYDYFKKISYRVFYNYNKAGKATKYVFIMPKGDTSAHVNYVYNRKGEKIAQNILGKNDTVRTSLQFKYKKGLPVKFITTDSSGHSYVYCRLFYDKQNRRVKSQNFDESKKLIGATYTTYNGNNKPIQIDWENKFCCDAMHTYTYDSLGNCIERIGYKGMLAGNNSQGSSWQSVNRKTFTYYPNGLLQEVTEYRDSVVGRREKHFYNR